MIILVALIIILNRSRLRGFLDTKIAASGSWGVPSLGVFLCDKSPTILGSALVPVILGIPK